MVIHDWLFISHGRKDLSPDVILWSWDRINLEGDKAMRQKMISFFIFHFENKTFWFSDFLTIRQVINTFLEEKTSVRQKHLSEFNMFYTFDTTVNLVSFIIIKSFFDLSSQGVYTNNWLHSTALINKSDLMIRNLLLVHKKFPRKGFFNFITIILGILEDNGAIESFNEESFHFENEKINYTTEKYFRLLNPDVFIANDVNLDFSISPPILIQIEKDFFVFRGHFSLIKRLSIPKKEYEEGAFIFKDTTYIHNFLNSPRYINFDELKSIMLLIEETNGWFFEKMDEDITNLHNSLEANRLIKQKKKEDYYERDKIKRKIQKLYEFKMIKSLLNLKYDVSEGIYFSFFVDYRGREYEHGKLSVSFHKIFRLVLDYGDRPYQNIDYFDSEFSPLIETYQKEVDIVKKHFNIQRSDRTTNEEIFWNLIAIGYTLNEKKKAETYTIEILETALMYLSADICPIELKLYDKLYLHHILLNLKEINLHKRRIRTIEKDHTSSGTINMVNVLGEQNDEALLITNRISNLCHYDTYRKIMEYYEKTHQKLPVSFNRAILKKNIMTIQYSAKIFSCTNKTRAILQNDGRKGEGLSIEEAEALKSFYKFMTKGEFDEWLFSTNSDIINDTLFEIYKKDNSIMVDGDDGKLFFKYNQKEKGRLDFKFRFKNGKKTRITKQIWSYSNELDRKALKQASKPGIAHYCDGFRGRQVVQALFKRERIIIFRIHDSYFFPSHNITLSVRLVNEAFNTDVLKKYFKNSRKVQRGGFYIVI